MRRRFGIISSMKKRTREKVALLVFALLVVLGGSVLLRYFETGRSFNMAATAVDDAFGQMSGYTAIVFDGTYDVLDALRPTKLPSVDGGAEERPETLGEMVAAELARLPLSMRERPVYASDVRSFYEEKGAGVLTLNVDDLARYEKPRILMAGDRKIGVVSVDYYASARQLEKLHELHYASLEVEDQQKRADMNAHEIIPVMDALRAAVDAMEIIVEREAWPVPTYNEILFYA